MNILVIGGGGREHAIVHCLKKSERAGKIYCLPSNAGIDALAERVTVPITDFPKIVEFLDAHTDIELTVVAPDNPLADGLVNFLEERGHRAFGPRAEAAIIEGSKIFAKKLMIDNNIPTADYRTFYDFDSADVYIKTAKYPLVVKADGLAYGKGVIICQNYSDAFSALRSIMVDAVFGRKNTSVIVEQFLTGKEASILIFTDGKSFKCMPSSQDHKKAFDGDLGPNTGGMGAFSPSPYFTDDLYEKTVSRIIIPTLEAMNRAGRTFKGVLYFGIIICGGEPYVLEYNARFGDPETQAVLSLLDDDLLDIFEAVIDGKLSEREIKWKDGAAVTVVLASSGYPAEYKKGVPITIGDIKDSVVFHAGSAVKDGCLVTAGGRVMAVTAVGKDIAEARDKAYADIKNISFDGMFYRKDIGIEL